MVKFEVPAGQAKPVPPISSVLGSKGIKPMEFCNQFNERSANIANGTLLPVKLYIRGDKSFSFVIKSPSVTYMIKQSMGIKSCSKEPGKSIVGNIARSAIEEIAKKKMEDLNCSDLDAAVAIISGSARSMGVLVVD